MDMWTCGCMHGWVEMDEEWMGGDGGMDGWRWMRNGWEEMDEEWMGGDG